MSRSSRSSGGVPQQSSGLIAPGLAFIAILAAEVATHLSLLRLPYFWDEGGYYVPAALDFYHTGTLIPVFTNAHPPVPSILLGTAWHVFGFHILVTRLVAVFFAAVGVTAVFSLGKQLLGTWAGWLLALLTAVYPIWFAQASLAHADIFAAAFSLLAFNLYFTSPDLIDRTASTTASPVRVGMCSLMFCCSVLAKETAVVQPVALLGLELMRQARRPKSSFQVAARGRWVLALFVPLPVLASWFAYHFLKTGHIFGNPVYLRYNATDNFTVDHILYALRIRFVHLVWQRFMWLPLGIAAACSFLPRQQSQALRYALPRYVVFAIGTLLVANWCAFSVLGGALLTRYLLPMYPLMLLIAIAVWQQHLRFWAWPGVLTACAFIPAIWLNPSTFFAPEDNLTYRNMVLVHKQAIDFLAQHYPDATVLTAWPVAADLSRPELGYTSHRFRTFDIENFTAPELQKAQEHPGSYDTAIVFTTHYTTPAFRSFLLQHPSSWRARRYAADIDLTPAQLARTLGSTVVWQNNIDGEWAAVLRFNRTYDAQLAR